MINQIKDNLKRMNWLSLSVLKFSAMLACALLLISLWFQFKNTSITAYNLPIETAKIAIAIFTEGCVASFLIDYYVKKHGDEQEN